MGIYVNNYQSIDHASSNSGQQHTSLMPVSLGGHRHTRQPGPQRFKRYSTSHITWDFVERPIVTSALPRERSADTLRDPAGV